MLSNKDLCSLQNTIFDSLLQWNVVGDDHGPACELREMTNSTNPLLSPKQVAQAIGVSESSLKRWCDQGRIPMICTAGGHRRLPLSGVLEFIRSSKRTLVDPEAIHLQAHATRKPRSLAAARQCVQAALVAGDEAGARQMLLDLFVGGQRISAIGDEVIAESFVAIGKLWECQELEVYRERLACRICSRVLTELRGLLPASRAGAPLALGCSPEGDVYELPTTLVELVLRESGWNATSLGSSLPLATILAAIEEHRPKLFWLSISHIADQESFLHDVAALYQATAGQTALVVGGRALLEPIRRQMQFAAFGDNLRHLEATAATLWSSTDTLPLT
jgi:excisionase family DNA binding protein